MTDYRDILESVGYPTDVLVLDFECFFDKSYSITKLGIVEYVFDPRFAVTGLGAYESNRLEWTGFYSPDNVRGVLKTMQEEYGPNLQHVTVVGHNLPFDCLVLREHFGITPKYTVDTIDLARHLDARGKHSLEHLAKKYGSPTPKGDTQQFSGLRWEDMTPEQQANLSEYCRNDIDITAHLLKVLLPRITRPDQELRLATQTLRMFLVPQIQMDLELGHKLIEGMEGEVQTSVDAVNAQGLLVEEPPKITTRTCSPPTVRKVRADDISGDKMFAKLLQEALPDGENIPMKQGKNKMIPALAKSDDQCNYLLSHPSPVVRALMDARKAAGSWPGHISRVRRLISQAECRDGLWGVPLRYYGAHTGRYSGTGGVNPQNFGARDVHDLIKQVGQMLMAPDGYIFGTGDLSQIEARVIAWFAGQDDLVQAFADGNDIYSEFAQDQVFHKETRKPREDDSPEYADELRIRRSFGKEACVAEGSPVLTGRGAVPIELVLDTDLVWDGVEFVSHQGVVCRGEKQCVQTRGVWMTPEHEVWQQGGWTTAAELSIDNQESGISMGNSRLLVLKEARLGALSPSNVVAGVVECLLRQYKILSREILHAVMCVLKRHPGKLRRMSLLYQTRIGGGFLDALVRSLADANDISIQDMVDEVSEYGPLGSVIERRFLTTWQHYQDGMIRVLQLTGLITKEDMSRVIYDSQPTHSNTETQVYRVPMGKELLDTVSGATGFILDDKSGNASVQNIALEKRRTYDIVNAGPRHRYQVGPMIVANCLALGFGMGGNTFYDRCRANPALRPLFLSGEYDLPFCKRLVQLYRNRYPKIVSFWYELDKAWKFVTRYKDQRTRVSHNGHTLEFFNEGGTTTIILPSGRHLFYPRARVSSDGYNAEYGSKPSYHIYGGKLAENAVQATARDVFAHGLLLLEDAEFNSLFSVHDQAINLLVDDDTAPAKLAEMHHIQTIAPDWADGLPIATEGVLTKRYHKGE